MIARSESDSVWAKFGRGVMRRKTEVAMRWTLRKLMASAGLRSVKKNIGLCHSGKLITERSLWRDHRLDRGYGGARVWGCDEALAGGDARSAVIAIPIELFRFRVVRDVQAQRVDRYAVDLTGLPTVPAAPGERDEGLGGKTVDPDTLDHWLRDVSSELALHADRIAPDEMGGLLPTDWKAEVHGDGWAALKADLAGSLAAAFTAAASGKAPRKGATVEALSRLIRVQALVEKLLDDEGRPAAERALASVGDVERATHATVILPKGYFSLCPNKPRLIREPGVTDFYVVRDEWNRYEAGELARVVNVLPGELFDERRRHRDSTETIVSSSVDSKTSEQTENSQTASTSLSQTSTTDASINIGVQAQVEVSGQYGPAHIDASAGAQVQASLTHSETKAFVTATENVQRSVKEVAKTVVTTQWNRTTSTDVNSERHKLSSAGPNVTVGLYRWLSEVHRVQIWRYPNRLVLEFEIPEPGAWLRWAMENAPTSFFNQDPGPFRLQGASHDLSPTDLDAAAIAAIATQWRIQGLPTPPPARMVPSVKLTSDPSSAKDPGVASDNSLIVPDGYVANEFYGEVFGEVVHTQGANPLITLTVGGSSASQVGKGSGGAPFAGGSLGGKVGPVNTGSVPVTVYTTGVQGFTCTVNVYCDVMPETVRQWQQAAFDEIALAYQNLRRAHQQELEQSALKPGSLAGLVGPPELNRARITAELRRLVIEELIGQRFVGAPAIDTGNADEPDVDLDDVLTVGPTVQFFEQAFEWENMIYICYPYYWARRTKWPLNALAATPDPQFDQFLNSGSARVVVPARPGFEHAVNYFRYTGCIWNGGQPPAPNDPRYLSVAQEIQAIQTGATDGTPVRSSWEISLPTTLLWAGDDPATLPVNPHPTIAAPTV